MPSGNQRPSAAKYSIFSNLFECFCYFTVPKKPKKQTLGFSLRTPTSLQSSRVLEGIVIVGLESVVVVLLPLFAVFINFYNLSKTLHLNHTSIDYVICYSSYVIVIFRSQLFNLCIPKMSVPGSLSTLSTLLQS